MLKKKWNIHSTDEAATARLREVLKVHPVICSLLVQRGITTFEAAKDFFRPSLEKLHSPWLMKDMKKAVERIQTAFERKEKILVFGDYDVDGTTAVASFYQFIREIYQSTHTDFYIPHRYREGYGVSKAGIDYAAENGFSLIVCLDCGIKSAELIAYAKTLGVDFIICDHHLPGAVLPDACAILNPKQPDCTYPYKELCGCGIGFKLMTALAETFSLPAESYLRHLDLLATAIAADIVPINGENRILAYHGMKRINENPCAGIKAMIQLEGLQKNLHITNVVFIIAPRINAAGRMDDARKAVRLFLETDEEKAMELAGELQSDNSDRKKTDSSITEEAISIINADEKLIRKKSSVLYREYWHKGVVGIVASRLIEHYYRPTIVLTKNDDVVTGSARSVKGFNVYEAIYECRDHLLSFGGHFAAAGLSLLPEKVEGFTAQFEEVVSRNIEDHMLIPEISIDAAIELSDMKESFYKLICQMEPFGPENMKPVFISTNVMNTGQSRILKERHVRFVVKKNNATMTGIGFNMAEKFESIPTNEPLDIVFTIDENEFQGKKSLQMKVIDFNLSEKK